MPFDPTPGSIQHSCSTVKTRSPIENSGFGTIEPFLQSALDRLEGIGHRLPQIYTCDSKTIGTADIEVT